jgi:hypothetical protein
VTRTRWRKAGLLIPGSAPAPWAVSHAALPVVDRIGDGRGLRVYVSARDERGRAQIGCVEWNPSRPADALPLSQSPVLAVGALGAFDDSGVTSSCIVTHQGRKYLYYTGWTRGVTVPFYLFAGLATSDDDGRTFARVSAAPILERNSVDPFLTASPFVLVESGVWRMWYVSATDWRISNGEPRHYYHIRYAESRNGVEWRRRGRVCIDFAGPDEHAIARPCVIRDGGTYRMWYSYRGARYRIGYAESADGLSWTRMDDLAGIDVSETGWDSEMVEYPLVFEHDGRLLMLYNGNDYGKTGCGLAESDHRVSASP